MIKRYRILALGSGKFLPQYLIIKNFKFKWISIKYIQDWGIVEFYDCSIESQMQYCKLDNVENCINTIEKFKKQKKYTGLVFKKINK
jgi:hypothetical protein